MVPVASHGRSGSAGVSLAAAGRIALALGGAGQGGSQFFAQQAEIPLYPAFSADQDMIMIRQSGRWQHFPQQRTKAALHAVADHRIADLLGNGDAIALALAVIRARQKHETGACYAQAPVGSQKISPPRKDGHWQ